jgi:hypothetical protein
MVFVRFPFTVIVALRVNVHLPNGGSVPPLKEKLFAPGVPLSVPPQVPTLKFTGLARIIPPVVSVGMLSVNEMFVRVTFPGLISSRLMVEAEPPKTVNGSKPLTRSIARALAASTVRFATRLLVGTRFSLFEILEGGMVLV